MKTLAQYKEYFANIKTRKTTEEYKQFFTEHKTLLGKYLQYCTNDYSNFLNEAGTLFREEITGTPMPIISTYELQNAKYNPHDILHKLAKKEHKGAKPSNYDYVAIEEEQNDYAVFTPVEYRSINESHADKYIELLGGDSWNAGEIADWIMEQLENEEA